MAKYFYYFETAEEADAWTPPENQVYVAFAEAYGVWYSSMGSPLVIDIVK